MIEILNRIHLHLFSLIGVISSTKTNSFFHLKPSFISYS